MAPKTFILLAVLLPFVSSLTDDELSNFITRNHTEQNTNLQGTVTVSNDGEYHRIVSNGIPDHTTGTFPGKGNPNNIQEFTFTNRVAKKPTQADKVTCLPNGPIAFARNGIPLFNPFNIDGENAVEGEFAEVFDDCNGHPDVTGIYHYHHTPDCIYSGINDEFIGVALDGFPIYGIKDSDGNDVKTADLDQCHGRVENGQYRYRLTRDYPYILGCYKGTVSPDVQERRLTDSSCKIVDAQSGAEKAAMSLMCMVVFSVLSLLTFY